MRTAWPPSRSSSVTVTLRVRVLPHVGERLLGDAEEDRGLRHRGLRRELVVQPVFDAGVALGRVERERERDRETLLLEARRMQLVDEMAEAGDRELHGPLGFREQPELIGIVDRATQHLQAHAHGGDDLDRVVVDALGDAAALELARRHEVGEQLAPLRGATARPLGGRCFRRRWRVRAILHASYLRCGCSGIGPESRAVTHNRISL